MIESISKGIIYSIKYYPEILCGPTNDNILPQQIKASGMRPYGQQNISE